MLQSPRSYVLQEIIVLLNLLLVSIGKLVIVHVGWNQVGYVRPVIRYNTPVLCSILCSCMVAARALPRLVEVLPDLSRQVIP